MGLWTALTHWLRALLRRDALEAELDDELHFHLEEQIRRYRAQGLSAEEAEAAAHRTIGSVAALKDEVRDTWHPARAVDDVRRDLASAWRSCTRLPAFTLVLVATLAIGIGATTAMFSQVNAIFLKPLPVAAPEQLRTLYWATPGSPPRRSGSVGRFSYPAYRAILEQSRVFSDVACWSGAFVNLADHGRVEAQLVSGNYFRTLRATPALGRAITVQDDQGAAVAVLSYRLWQRSFGGDPSVIGAPLRVNGQPATIVGVMPRRFFGLNPARAADVYVSLPMYSSVRFDTTLKPRRLSDPRDWSACEVVARLRDQVGDAAARSEVLVRLEGARLAPPASSRGQPELHVVSAAAGMDDLRLETRDTLPLLMVATVLILLVACANVAAMLLARAPTRMNEVATRLALGASRARVVRQLATEGVFVSVAGGALGLVCAYCLNRAIPGLLGSLLGGGAEIGRVEATLDARVVGFTALVAMATGMVCSVAPAMSVTRSAADPAAVRRRSQIRLFPRVSPITALVAVQPMVAVILLVVAGLSLRTVTSLRMLSMEPEPDHLLHFNVDLRLSGYAAEDTRHFVEQVLAQVRDVPGVTAVAASQGSGPCAPGQGGSMRILAVTPDYFRIAAVPTRAGRTVDRTDEVAGAPPVVVVSSAIAARHLNSPAKIGELLAICGSTPTHRVIGVIGERATDAVGRRRPLDRGPRQPPLPYVYIPLLHPSAAVSGAYISFSLRTAGSAAQVVPDVHRVVSGIDPNVPPFDVETGRARNDRIVAPERSLTTLLMLLGGASVFLACLGLYGVVSYAVRRRTREMAIRATAGGAPLEIVALIVRQALVPALVGILAGSVVTVLIVGPTVRDFLYGVSPQDPLVLTVALGSLAVTSLVAALVPGLRAARLDLGAVLHAE